MIKVEGLHGISATVLAHSKSSVSGKEIISFEIEAPRIILAEENTHRAISKSSASSRAIPFAKMKEQLTGRPVRFGQANPGMQDKGVDFDATIDVGRAMGFSHPYIVEPAMAWDIAKEYASGFSQVFFEAGYHKQVYNRLTEPFQMIKTIMTATEWNNFFWLRDHEAADPTFAELARCMREAKEQSTAFELEPGQWHLPYVDWMLAPSGQLYWRDEHGTHVPAIWDDLKKVSAARSAAVSFRNVDYTLEKSLQVYERLVGDERKHASAFEHQATPMQAYRGENSRYLRPVNNVSPSSWEEGVTHIDKNYSLWSGNFEGWIQFRKLIPGENLPG